MSRGIVTSVCLCLGFATIVVWGSSGCSSAASAQPKAEKASPAGQGAAGRASRSPSPFLFEPPPASRAFESWSLRETIEDALTRIGPATVPELRRWLADPNPEVRRHAANLLGRIGPKAFDAIPDLIIMLDDENANVRKHAARALGQIGPSAAESSPALLRILREEILKEQALGHPGR